MGTIPRDLFPPEELSRNAGLIPYTAGTEQGYIRQLSNPKREGSIAFAL